MDRDHWGGEEAVEEDFGDEGYSGMERDAEDLMRDEFGDEDDMSPDLLSQQEVRHGAGTRGGDTWHREKKWACGMRLGLEE